MAEPERGEPHLWGRPQTHRLRPWGFPTVSPSHPSLFPHHGIQQITVEFSEESQRTVIFPSTPDPAGVNGPMTITPAAKKVIYQPEA